MKNLLKKYFTFNKSERIGLIALLSIIFILLAVRITMRHMVTVDINSAEEARLRKEWAKFKAKHTVKELDNIKAPAAEQNVITAKTISKVTPANTGLFPFDPNTIDSTGLRKLGLREKTTVILLHWRAKGKVFLKKEELRKVYTLTEEEYQRLEPYIVISP